MSFNIHDCYTTYINLDHRVDRRERVEKSLDAAGLQAVRTRGLLWEECVTTRRPLRTMPRHKRIVVSSELQCMFKDNHRGAGHGNIGCHFSHVACLEKARALGKDAFIMEDDLVICSDLHKRLGIITEFLNTHPWDIFWLSALVHTRPAYWHPRGHPHMPDCKCNVDCDSAATDHPNIIRTYGSFTTTAYLVNKNSLDKVLTACKELLPISYAIDHLYIRLQPYILSYAFIPGCVCQYDDMSDISNSWSPQTNCTRIGPWCYQDKMTDFDTATMFPKQ